MRQAITMQSIPALPITLVSDGSGLSRTTRSRLNNVLHRQAVANQQHPQHDCMSAMHSLCYRFYHYTEHRVDEQLAICALHRLMLCIERESIVDD
jgi:hypothetical protein